MTLLSNGELLSFVDCVMSLTAPRDPRGELMVSKTEQVCATLKEREVDIYFASIVRRRRI